MTRLIDADVLIGYVNKYDTGGPIGKALRAMLEKSPTVDAIPIAMIQREIDNWDRKKPQSFHAIAYRHLIEDWGREQGILETTRNYSKRGNGDPNGFNEETVQALKDTTERKNLSKVYETLDDMYVGSLSNAPQPNAPSTSASTLLPAATRRICFARFTCS